MHGSETSASLALSLTKDKDHCSAIFWNAENNFIVNCKILHCTSFYCKILHCYQLSLAVGFLADAFGFEGC